MEIKKVAIVKGKLQLPLKYDYDDWNLRVKLDKTYRNTESYSIYIEYTAKPDEFEAKYSQGSLLGMKGMYFVNPRGEEKDRTHPDMDTG